MAECLHLYFCLKAGFELEGKAIIVNSDTFDQSPDQPFIVVRHRLLVLLQKGFELVQALLESCTVGFFDQQVLLFFPERIDLVGQFLKTLLGVGFLQEFLLQCLQLLVDQYFFLTADMPLFQSRSELKAAQTDTAQ